MKSARIVVEIQTNEEGELKCAHRPLTPEDRAELESWPSGGLVHMAQALLIETLRRESYVMAISHLSLGNAFEDLTVKEIEDLTRAQIAQMVDTFAPAVAEETMKRLSGS